MPYRTVYSISGKGKKELRDTLIKSIVSFDFDTNIFSIAVFFIDFFEPDEQIFLLKKRAEILKKYIAGIENWILYREDISIPFSHIVIVERMADLAKTELAGTNKLLEMLQTN